MTTNYFEKLDSALIRPGRVDVVHKVGYITPSQTNQLFSRFYPDAEKAVALEFSDKIVSLNQNLSPAQVSLYFDFVSFFRFKDFYLNTKTVLS